MMQLGAGAILYLQQIRPNFHGSRKRQVVQSVGGFTILTLSSVLAIFCFFIMYGDRPYHGAPLGDAIGVVFYLYEVEWLVHEIDVQAGINGSHAA
jgi:hypothetical protein